MVEVVALSVACACLSIACAAMSCSVPWLLWRAWSLQGQVDKLDEALAALVERLTEGKP